MRTFSKEQVARLAFQFWSCDSQDVFAVTNVGVTVRSTQIPEDSWG
jgi:hypothetical protein